MRSVRSLITVPLLLCLLLQAPAQKGARTPISEMRSAIERYTVDRGSLTRSYPVAVSHARRERFKKFYSDWLASLQSLDFDSMSQDGKIDYILFKNHLEYELRQLEIQSRQISEIEPLLSFGARIIELEEARRRMEPIDAARVATTLNDLRKQVDERRRALELGLRQEQRSGDSDNEPVRMKKTVANRAVVAINSLRGNLRNWYTFYNGYDPIFTWWNEEPYKSLDQAITNYATFLTERVVGIKSEAGGQTQAGPNPRPGGGSGGQGPQRPGGSNARPGDA